METVFIRVTIPNVKLADVVGLKEAIDKLVENYHEATTELNIVNRPLFPAGMRPPAPPGG